MGQCAKLAGGRIPQQTASLVSSETAEGVTEPGDRNRGEGTGLVGERYLSTVTSFFRYMIFKLHSISRRVNKSPEREILGTF